MNLTTASNVSMNFSNSNSSPTTSCSDDSRFDKSFFDFRIGISSVLITLIIIANTILALFLWRAKSARRIKNGYFGFYLFNLCIIDFIAAFDYSFMTACTILSSFNYECPSAISWRTYSSIHILLSSAYITTVAVMVFERLILTRNTLLRRESLRRMKYKLYFTWVWSLTNALPQLMLYKNGNDHDNCTCNCTNQSDFVTLKRMYSGSRVITMFILPSSVIVVSVFGVLTRHSCESALALKRKKEHERFSYLVLLLWLSFVCSNMPKIVYEINSSLKDKHREKESERISRRHKHMYTVLISLSIHLLTPIIYAIIYANILKTDIKKLRIYEYPSETVRKMSQFTLRRFSSDPNSDELDGLSTRSILLNLGMHQDNILQRLSIDIGIDDSNYNRRTSVIVDHIRRHSLFSADIRKINRKQSLACRKRSSVTGETLTNLSDGRFLTPFPPTFEYSLNTLNQKSPLLEEHNRTRGKSSSLSMPVNSSK